MSGPMAWCPEATSAADNKLENPLANEASPAALPKKFAHPHVYDANGAHSDGTNIAAQWYTDPALGYAPQR